jgi:hypothetical protein
MVDERPTSVWCQVGAKRWLALEDDALQAIVPEVVAQGQQGFIHDEECEVRTGPDDCQPFVVNPLAPDQGPEGYPIQGRFHVLLSMDAWYADEATRDVARAAAAAYTPVLMHMLRARIEQALRGDGEAPGGAHLN